MKTGLYDWEEISRNLVDLRQAREGERQRAAEEIARLQATIQSTNEQFDGFAFRLVETWGDGNPYATIEVSLYDVRSEIELPWSLAITYFYEGHRHSYFRQLTQEGHYEAKNRLNERSGVNSAIDWFGPLGDLAKLNIRETPRPKDGA